MEELRNRYRITALIGAAMIAGVFVYLGVAEFIKNSYPIPAWANPSPQWKILRIALFAVALSEIVGMALIKRLLLYAGISAPQSNASSPSLAALAQKLATTSIILFAFSESIAIYGLVDFFITGISRDLYIFIALSILAFAFYFPRYSQWEKYVREKVGASPGGAATPPGIG